MQTLDDSKNSKDTQAAVFIPMMYMKDLSTAIEFYKKAFGADERWRINNSDGSTHVAEMSISSIRFRMHEEVTRALELSPAKLNATRVEICLLVDDPDALAARAISAGATEISPVQDYEYGFRQGTIRDPFGHQWCLEKLGDLKKIPIMPD